MENAVPAQKTNTSTKDLLCFIRDASGRSTAYLSPVGDSLSLRKKGK